ncbi:hypothetical protein V6N11_080606 [Hibiscus sabdariffa]|uniref:RNase H type-1 domain-containing protein n=1 Tax=Hibiscus sabdariffa TaxID=183260 RepID=A0ABR2R887_9ROSI
MLGLRTTPPLPGRASMRLCRNFERAPPGLRAVIVIHGAYYGEDTTQDCLLVGGRIRAAGLGLGLCPFCLAVVETPLHAFRDCHDAAEALCLAGFPKAVIFNSASLMLDWLVESAGLLSRSDFAKVLLLLWNMWNRRNRLVHDSQPQLVWATVASAGLLHVDFLAANDQSRWPASATVFSPDVWFSPPLGTIAISVDGAFTPARGAGIGVVARYSTGSILGGLAQHSFRLVSSDYTEATAILAGLQLACDRGWDRIVLETDCASVANILNNDHGLDLCSLAPMLSPIRSLLSAYPLFHVRYVSRDVNIVAHTLATWALQCLLASR